MLDIFHLFKYLLKNYVTITIVDQITVPGLSGIILFPDTGNRSFEPMALKAHVAKGHGGQTLKLTKPRVLSEQGTEVTKKNGNLHILLFPSCMTQVNNLIEMFIGGYKNP